MTRDVLEAHRDGGLLAAVIPAAPTTSTPWVVALVPVVAAVAVAAAVGHRGLVVAVGAVAVVIGGVASAARTSPTLGWLVPPALRLLEYGCLIGIAWVHPDPGAMPAAVALLLPVVGHHYEALYRVSALGVGPARWVRWALGGWEGRTLVVLAAGGTPWFVPLVWSLAAWCAGLALVDWVWTWWPRAAADDWNQ